jgi:hypothetical protein
MASTGHFYFGQIGHYHFALAAGQVRSPWMQYKRKIGLMIAVGLLFFLAASPSDLLLRKVSLSGRVLGIGTPAADRLRPPREIAPGAPPLVSFRFFEGKARHRFSGLDLVIDDAGH